MAHILTSKLFFQGEGSMENTEDENAVGLGEASIHQSFFVCVTEWNKGVLIEYGKSQGSSDEGDVFLAYTDSEKGDSKPLNVRFYAFFFRESSGKDNGRSFIVKKVNQNNVQRGHMGG